MLARKRFLITVSLAGFTLLPLIATAADSSGSLAARENNEGQVTVKVTPENLADGEAPWRFAVQLNTHVSPLTQDLEAVSVLSDGQGHQEPPLSWQGDPPGGHHRRGTLIFKPIRPQPDSVTLKIRQVGSVPERAFTWELTGR